MCWLRPECPIRTQERDWIDRSLDWLAGQFGDGVLHRPVLLPTPESFPVPYAGTAEDVEEVLGWLCGHLGVDRSRIVLDFDEAGDHLPLAQQIPLAWKGTTAAGHWQRRNGRSVITVGAAMRRDPVGMVATIAHELGHERLLGEGRIERTRKDHEPLTDLLTVHFGIGIFAANCALRFAANQRRWQARRLGYLTEPMYGYALAVYARRRGERKPPWRRHLDTNPRVYLRRCLRYLRTAPTSTGGPIA